MDGGIIEGQDGSRHLYVDLTVDDGDEVEDDSWRKRFLLWDEIDDREGQRLRNVGRTKKYDSGLIIKLEDISQRYANLERGLVESGRVDYNDPAREQLRGFKQVFDKLQAVVRRAAGNDVAEVCQIFERINQAGQPLSMFDIVVAKTFRPAADGVPGFYLRANSSSSAASLLRLAVASRSWMR